MSPSELSRQLRTESDPHLRRRRGIVALSLVGVAAAAAVTAFQTGLVRRLPSLPGELFDATRVDASDYAYSRLQSPDGPIMLVSYGLTAWLAAAGGRDRAVAHPWLPVALAAKVIYDAVVAVRLGREEWRDNQALCDYCQAATLASLGSVVLAVPEARAAIDRMRGLRHDRVEAVPGA